MSSGLSAAPGEVEGAVGLSDGRATASITLPAITSSGFEYAPTLTYSSRTAEPTMCFGVVDELDEGIAAPDDVPTNVRSDEPARYERSYGGDVVVLNTRDSPFGGGWALAGASRLIQDRSGAMVVVDGHRSVRLGGSRILTALRNLGTENRALDACGFALEPDGSLLFTDGREYGNGDRCSGAEVYRRRPSGAVERVFSLSDTAFNGQIISGLAAGAGGEILIPTYSLEPTVPGRILRIDTDGEFGVLSETGTWVPPGNANPPMAGLNKPQDIEVDAAGNLYIATVNQILRVAASTGEITTLASTGSGTPCNPSGNFNNRPVQLALGPSGKVYWAEGDRVCVFNPSASPQVSTVWTGVFVAGLAVDAASNLYMSGGDRVWTNDGVEPFVGTPPGSEWAGDGTHTVVPPYRSEDWYCEDPGDGTAATAARLSHPATLIFDGRGDLLVSAACGTRRITRGGSRGSVDNSRVEVRHSNPADPLSSVVGYTRTFPNGAVEQYDQYGYIATRTDRNGKQVSYGWTDPDQEGVEPRQVTSITYPGSKAFWIAYPEAGSGTITITDPASRITTLTLTEGELTRAAFPGGTAEYVFDYESAHAFRLTGLHAPGRFGRVWRYDEKGRVEEMERDIRPVGLSEVRAYTPQDGAAETCPGCTPGAWYDAACTSDEPCTAPGDPPAATVADGEGVTRAFRYDRDRNLAEIPDAAGSRWPYERDENGLVTRRIEPVDATTERVWSYEYWRPEVGEPAALGLLGEVAFCDQPRVPATACQTCIDPPSDCECPSDCPPEWHVSWSAAYDEGSTRPRTVTSAAGVQTFGYDAAGNVTAVKDAAGTTTRVAYGYTTDGRPAWSRTAGNDDDHRRTWDYTQTDTDAGFQGWPMIVEKDETATPGSPGRRTTLDPDTGLVRRVRTPEGVETRYEQDVLGRLTKVKRLVGGQWVETVYGYTDFGCGCASSPRPTSIRLPSGDETYVRYNGAGRVEWVKAPLLPETTYEYDRAARLKKRTDPTGREWEWGYYAGSGRLEWSEDPAGNRTIYGYDEAGRVKTVTQTWRDYQMGTPLPAPSTAVTTYTYDHTGQVRTVTDPLGQTDPTGHVTTYTRDRFGRLIGYTDPLGRTETTVYNAGLLDDGVPHQRVLRDGTVLTHGYYASLRRHWIDYPDQQRPGADPVEADDEWTYWPDGRVHKATGVDAAYEYEYDGDRRLRDLWLDRTGAGLHHQYGYDPDRGHLAAIAGQAGAGGAGAVATPEVRFAQDPTGRESRVEHRAPIEGGSVNTFVQALNDPAGRIAWEFVGTFEDDGQGGTIDTTVFKVRYTWDPAGRLLGKTAQPHPSGATISEVSYGLEPARGLIQTMTTGGVTRSFVHDEVGRLAYASHQGFGWWQYRYDLAGNRVLEDDGFDDRIFNVGPGNRLASITAEVPETFHYTDNGAVDVWTLGATATTTRTFGYDDRQRMTEATVEVAGGGSQTWTYGYDVNAWRVRKTGPGGTRRYFRDQRTLEEWSGDAAPLALERQFVFRPDGFTPLLYCGREEDGTPFCDYVFTDHLGTPLSTIAVEDGTVTWSVRLAPFGAVESQTSNDMPIRFPGQWADDESEQTGLYYNWWRWYGAGLGAYLAPDPLDLAKPIVGGMLYAYAAGNPLAFFDPLGLMVRVCSRPLRNWMGKYLNAQHKWFWTDTKEAGIQTYGPDNAYARITDHYMEHKDVDASCEERPDVDENCVNSKLQIGKVVDLYVAVLPWGTDCWSFVKEILNECAR